MIGRGSDLDEFTPHLALGKDAVYKSQGRPIRAGASNNVSPGHAGTFAEVDLTV